MFAGSDFAAKGNAAEKSPWEQRFEQERIWREQGMVMIPYRGNYIFPITYNTTPHGTSVHSPQYKEAKFQLSFKVLLLEDILNYDAHLYFGYTQLSMWQLYDRERSAPFRDTNYEPELIATLNSVRPLRQIMLRKTDLGIVHQSNGTRPPDSRSWNRVYARFHFDIDNFAFAIRPWWRIPDPDHRDDNQNIERYMGYGDAVVAYSLKNHIISVLVRNNFKTSDNKGAVEINYSFPLTRILTGLVQYFNGYGESLIDYNRRVNRFSLGIALSDWH